MTTATEYVQRLSAAIARGQAAHDPLDEDLSRWPEDVREILAIFCREWHFRAPRDKQRKAFWIKSARQLVDAAGEFGVAALQKYRQEFEGYMASHGGLPKHDVCGPQSLVNEVAKAAAQMRNEKAQEPQPREYIEPEPWPLLPGICKVCGQDAAHCSHFQVWGRWEDNPGFHYKEREQ